MKTNLKNARITFRSPDNNFCIALLIEPDYSFEVDGIIFFKHSYYYLYDIKSLQVFKILKDDKKKVVTEYTSGENIIIFNKEEKQYTKSFIKKLTKQKIKDLGKDVVYEIFFDAADDIKKIEESGNYNLVKVD